MFFMPVEKRMWKNGNRRELCGQESLRRVRHQIFCHWTNRVTFQTLKTEKKLWLLNYTSLNNGTVDITVRNNCKKNTWSVKLNVEMVSGWSLIIWSDTRWSTDNYYGNWTVRCTNMPGLFCSLQNNRIDVDLTRYLYIYLRCLCTIVTRRTPNYSTMSMLSCCFIVRTDT